VSGYRNYDVSTLWAVGERKDKKSCKQKNCVCFLELRFYKIAFVINDLRRGDRCIADEHGDAVCFYFLYTAEQVNAPLASTF
jgi:hypothetical protein